MNNDKELATHLLKTDRNENQQLMVEYLAFACGEGMQMTMSLLDNAVVTAYHHRYLNALERHMDKMVETQNPNLPKPVKKIHQPLNLG